MPDEFGGDESELDKKLKFLFSDYAKTVFEHECPGKTPPSSKLELARLVGRAHSNFSGKTKLSHEMSADVLMHYGVTERGRSKDCFESFRDHSCQAFIDAFEDLHGDRGRTPPIKPVQRDTSHLLQEDWDFVPAGTAQKMETDLASLALRSGQTTGPGAPGPGCLNLSFDLNCKNWRGDHFDTIVKFGTLYLDLGQARTSPLKDRKGYPGGAAIDGARLFPASADARSPSWSVEGRDGGGIGYIGEAPVDFAYVQGLAVGDIMFGEFVAPVREVSTTFRLPEGEPGNKMKQRIKQRLQAMQFEEREPGIAILARASLKVRKRED